MVDDKIITAVYNDGTVFKMSIAEYNNGFVKSAGKYPWCWGKAYDQYGNELSGPVEEPQPTRPRKKYTTEEFNHWSCFPSYIPAIIFLNVLAAIFINGWEGLAVCSLIYIVYGLYKHNDVFK